MMKKERFLIYAGKWRVDDGSSPSHAELDLNHIIRKELVYQGVAEWKIVNGKPCCDLIEIIGGGSSTTTFEITPSSTSATFNVNGISKVLDLVGTTNSGLMSVVQATNLTALGTLSGVTAGTTSLGTFIGSTITDNSTIKNALQELETATETKQKQLSFYEETTLVGSAGKYDKISFLGASVTATEDTLDATKLNVTITTPPPPTSILEYSAGNGALVTATGTGVTFVRTTASVWTFNIPTGVKLLSHDIYSLTGENPGLNVTINYNYVGNTVTNQGLSTARRPSYLASNAGAVLTNDFLTGGTTATNFKPSINTVGGGNISMLIQTGTAFATTSEPTNIKGIF